MNQASVRPVLARLHRWTGLALVLFLLMAGLSGSIIGFSAELDSWLNPDLLRVAPAGAALSPDALAARLERQDGGVLLSYLPFRVRPGEAIEAKIIPRDPARADPGYDEVFLDPVTGRILGHRLWGACCFSRRALLPFLYRFHHTLAAGRPGEIVMGTIALIWLATVLAGLYLALAGRAPLARKLARRLRVGAWRPAARALHDLHRALGLWFIVVMPASALTGAALALEAPVVRPLLSLVSPLVPIPSDRPRPCDAAIGLNAAIADAERFARQRGWPGPAGSIFDDREDGEYAVYFFPDTATRGAGLGTPLIHVGRCDGALRQADMPGRGSIGDVLLQARLPLHSGQILGLPGRLTIAATGLAVATLAGTGTATWWQRRRQRAGRRITA